MPTEADALHRLGTRRNAGRRRLSLAGMISGPVDEIEREEHRCAGADQLRDDASDKPDPRGPELVLLLFLAAFRLRGGGWTMAGSGPEGLTSDMGSTA